MCWCNEQACATTTTHIRSSSTSQYESDPLEHCGQQLEAYEECVRINHPPHQNRPKINYTLMRLGNYFKPFKGFFTKVK